MAKEQDFIGYIEPTVIPFSNSTTFIDELIITLQNGLTASNVSSTYCCPSCVNKSGEQIYFLSDIPMGIQILEGMGYAKDATLDCCMNTVTQVTAQTHADLVATGYSYTPCVNNFLTCYDEISARLGKDCCKTLEEKGLVEYNTLTGTKTGSQICLILEYLLTIKPELSDAELCAAFSKILEVGIVIRCKDGKVIITDGCTYLDEVAPCTCWSVVATSTNIPSVINVTYKCLCTLPAVTVPFYNDGDTAYFCSRNLKVDSTSVVVTNLDKPCGECDLYIPCYCFQIEYPPIDGSLVNTTYTNCDGEVITFKPSVPGVYKVCSRVTPVLQTVRPIFFTITNLGLCEENPDCLDEFCYCWQIVADQGCPIVVDCNGVGETFIMPWTGLYQICSQTIPTSICSITAAKLKTCVKQVRGAAPCWDQDATRCFTVETSIVSSITINTGTEVITYTGVQPGEYTFCSTSDLSVSDPNAQITLNYLQCTGFGIDCKIAVPMKCYDITIPPSVISVNVIYRDSENASDTITYTPGIYALCSSNIPVALSSDPGIIIQPRLIPVLDCLDCVPPPPVVCNCYTVIAPQEVEAYIYNWVDCATGNINNALTTGGTLYICSRTEPTSLGWTSSDVTLRSDLDCLTGECVAPPAICNCWGLTPTGKFGNFVTFTYDTCDGIPVTVSNVTLPVEVCSPTSPDVIFTDGTYVTISGGPCNTDCGMTGIAICTCYTIEVTSNDAFIANVEIETYTTTCLGVDPGPFPITTNITSSDPILYICSERAPIISLASSNAEVLITMIEGLDCATGNCVAPPTP